MLPKFRLSGGVRVSTATDWMAQVTPAGRAPLAVVSTGTENVVVESTVTVRLPFREGVRVSPAIVTTWPVPRPWATLVVQTVGLALVAAEMLPVPAWPPTPVVSVIHSMFWTQKGFPAPVTMPCTYFRMPG